ncbi:MAG: hypothetical protein CML04_01390 [Pseudozobellia sp.]|nr:hypothetical protein [Pseudozobellia sp.]MBG48838.1 hypothetical protein [Pseudozobellia sp.]|tara:strand:- start:755 stop:1597 length:843 start_codon:yes stop_codon:yes gene_type:complete
MRTIIKFIWPIIAILFFACEDVVEIDVPESNPRLVIEASLDWEKGSLGNNQSITLNNTTTYFDDERLNPVSDAIVTVYNVETASEFRFLEQEAGVYSTDTFIPLIDNTYRLEVLYEGETYVAEERMTSVATIDSLTQSREEGFDKDLLELNIYFSDPENEVNSYLIWCESNKDLFPYMFDINDEFINGNQVHHTYEKDDDIDNGLYPFEPDEIVEVKLFGISENYYRYIGLLISQSGGGNPFGAVPATLRGNIVNTTNRENYALGYFRTAEVDTKELTFQ